jgi:hypothetical protein
VNSWNFGLYYETLDDDFYRIKHLDWEFYDDENNWVQYVIVKCKPDDYNINWVILDKEFHRDDWYIVDLYTVYSRLIITTFYYMQRLYKYFKWCG